MQHLELVAYACAARSRGKQQLDCPQVGTYSQMLHIWLWLWNTCEISPGKKDGVKTSECHFEDSFRGMIPNTSKIHRRSLWFPPINHILRYLFDNKIKLSKNKVPVFLLGINRMHVCVQSASCWNKINQCSYTQVINFCPKWRNATFLFNFAVLSWKEYNSRIS